MDELMQQRPSGASLLGFFGFFGFFRPGLLQGAALLLSVALFGCGDDGNGGGGGGGDQGIRVEHEGEALVADQTVSVVNTFWSDEGAQLSTTVIAGWVVGSDFGAVTARLTLTGAAGEQVGPGVYTFTTDQLAPEEMTARLSLSGVEIEGVEDIDGIVDAIVGADGTVEVNAVAPDGDDKLGRLDLDFEGVFLEADAFGDPVGTVEIPLSGSIRVTRD